MLTVAEATARVRAALLRLPLEAVPLWDADGRILGADVVAARALPPWDNSAMDGFAVRAADLPGTLPIVGEVAAGHPRREPLPPGAAVRIMTGAPVPPGADAIVMVEDARVDGDRVTLPAAAAGAHVRRAAEDVAPGDRVLAAGHRLDAGALALLAALGHATVDVAARPRVAILSTGDELVDVATPLGPGQIVDSSAHALRAAVRAAGGEARYLGVVRDEAAATAAAIAAALDHDVVVTTGGVSVGEHDHVRGALGAAGVTLELWKVAMKPGKPFAFGVAPRARPVPVFALPGNPVSTMLAFELFVRPALLAMQGAARVDRPRVPVRLADGYRKPAGRAHYLRARLERDGEALVAHLHAKQGSAMLTSMLEAHAFVELAAEATEVAPGGVVTALLLEAT